MNSTTLSDSTSGAATETARVVVNHDAAITDGTPLDTLYLITAGLVAFFALQIGLALRGAGAARPHATHELLKKHVRAGF